jgi:hypothetical protein
MPRATSRGRLPASALAAAILVWVGTAAAEAQDQAVSLDAFAEDERTPLILNESEKNFLLWEMRQMLVSVQGIVAGLTKEDLELISESARAMGREAAAGVPPETVAKLPQQFRQWAGATHTEFDTISIAAREGETPDMIMFRLSDMLNLCVACHATYRIEVE